MVQILAIGRDFEGRSAVAGDKAFFVGWHLDTLHNLAVIEVDSGVLRLANFVPVDLPGKLSGDRVKEFVLRIGRATGEPKLLRLRIQGELFHYLVGGDVENLNATLVIGGDVDLLLVVRQLEPGGQTRVELDPVDHLTGCLVKDKYGVRIGSKIKRARAGGGSEANG